ncbi:MAG: hypothetical protein IT578_02460 [Verrucomicrobiae bacterium]|nr:hypothetical protein [Verrucomicrobiae bacterium]
METKRKRFNWRVSEGVAAEMIQARRLAGFRSWDDYFLSLLQRPPVPVRPREHPHAEELKALRREQQEMGKALTALRGYLEAQEEMRQADEHERAEVREMLRRFYELLRLALAPEAAESDTPRAPCPTGNPVLDAIRLRRSTA